MIENISYKLDYTTEGTDTLNYEDIKYRTPAVIITAKPDKLDALRSQAKRLIKDIDESNRSWERYAQRNPEQAAQEVDEANEATAPERDKLAELLDEIDALEQLQKKWEIDLVEEEDALYKYIDGDESALNAQIDAVTAAELKYAPDWYDTDAEKTNLHREISYVLSSLYALHRYEFTEVFLPARWSDLKLEGYRNAAPELKKQLFYEYWQEA